MGIENDIVLKYGKKYWLMHKEEILDKANKKGNLEQVRKFPNARQRRIINRMLQRHEISEEDVTKIEQAIARDKFVGNPEVYLE